MREAAVRALNSGSAFETLAVTDEGAAFPDGASPRHAIRSDMRWSFVLMVLPEFSKELNKYDV